MGTVLHTERVGEADAPFRLAYLHGSFGMGRNWSVIARRVAGQCPQWMGELVDLRGHGRSVGMAGPMSMEQAARDVVQLGVHHGWGRHGVLGHSLGGKVALAYAGMRPPGLERVWVIDSTPEVLEVGDAWRMLPLMRSLPREFATREAGYAALKERGLDDATAQWLAMNIHRTEEGRYRMVLDPDRLEPLLRDFYDRDLWEVVEEPPAGVMIHFVRASRQSVMSDGAAERIREIGRRTDQVVLHEVAGGHWLHVDAPEAVVQVITSSLCG